MEDDGHFRKGSYGVCLDQYINLKEVKGDEEDGGFGFVMGSRGAGIVR